LQKSFCVFEGLHYLPANARATPVIAWRLRRSAIAARLLSLREIDRPAFQEFCNTICQQETRASQQVAAYSITSSARASSVGGTSRPKRFGGLEVNHQSNFGSDRFPSMVRAFDTVDAAEASSRKLKSTYPMLQIEIYDTATKARTMLS
jgi:hypothetical protein